MRVVGKVPLFEADRVGGWMVLNPQSRRGYQLYDGPSSTIIWSFDLDTLRPVRGATFNGLLSKSLGGGDLIHAVDQDTRRLFFVGNPPTEVFGGINTTLGSVRQVIVFDEEAFDRGDADFLTQWPIPTAIGGLSPVGISFSREGGLAKLHVLVPEKTVASNFLNERVLSHLVQINAEVGGEGLVEWILPVGDRCERIWVDTNDGMGTQQVGLLRRPDALYFACEGWRLLPNNAFQGGTFGLAQIIKVPVEVGSSPPDSARAEVFSLPRMIGNVLIDRRWGRILLESTLGGSTLWVFDTTTDSWVGGIGMLQTSLKATAGIDPVTGRLYALVPDHANREANPPIPVQGGLKFADLSLTPAPQLTNAIPELAYPGRYRIEVDSGAPGRPTRLFVRRGHKDEARAYKFPNTSPGVIEAPQEDFYLVVEDTIPVASVEPLRDVDANTLDVEERPDVTDANFETVGAGYGVRSQWLAGLYGMTSGGFRDFQGNNCASSDREFVLGWVHSGRLTSLGASARALSFDTDLATRDDLKSPATRCVSPQLSAVDSHVGEQWRDFTAECVGKREDSQTQGAPGKFTQGNGRFVSEANCYEDEGKVEASASGFLSAGGGDPPIKAASGYSKVDVKRDSEGGVAVEVTSVAKGIEISGAASIAMVETKAISRAGGRPGTAKTSFTRTICRTSNSCTSDENEQKKMISDLNQILRRMGGTAYLRSPDSELAAGSPGGYLASIQRKRTEGPFDRDINRDYSLAVPGLEIIFTRGDSPSKGSGRHIYQFAGVQAESAYGIYCKLGRSSDGNCNAPLVDDFAGDAFDDSVDTEYDASTVLINSDEQSWAGSPFGGLGDAVQRIIQKIAEGLRLLLSSPKEAALMAAVWLLFWAPSYLGERRRMLLGV